MKKKILKKISLIASYAALLLLIMPVKTMYYAIAALLFLAGAAFIAVKMPEGEAVSGKKRTYLSLSAVLIASYLGLLFYYRWLRSTQARQILSKTPFSFETVLTAVAVCLALLSAAFIYSAVKQISKASEKLPEKYNIISNLIYGFIASAVLVTLSQVMADVTRLSMGPFKFFMGTLIVFLVIVLIYCMTGMIKLSIAAGTALFMILSTANAYVYFFRDRMLDPIDVLSVGTVMNVADNFSLFPVPAIIAASWLLFIGFTVMFCSQTKKVPGSSVKMRAVLMIAWLLGAVATGFYVSGLKTYPWQNYGARTNGYILNFAVGIKQIKVSKPDNYSEAFVEELSERYSQDTQGAAAEKDVPHLIVIMDEAFSDLNVVSELSTDVEVTPFISSIKENAVTGYALVSAYGGGTANSEYEFLTGNSMAWLPQSSVPYQQYIKSSAYSMVSYLKTMYSYKCMAFHPYLASGWNRPDAYKNLGFDKFFFMDSFPQKNIVRNYISDREMFEKIIEEFENGKEEPLFLFGITMQNHGMYKYSGPNYTTEVHLTGYKNNYPEVEQYLTLIHETDKAVKYLVEYFSESDEKVVIVFFGDHQPKISGAFFEENGQKGTDVMTQRQNKHKVPFFVWANYDIEEKQVECTSLNYLSTYAYEAAGLELPAYNRFLSDAEKIVPSINAYYFYSPTAQRYMLFDEASGEEREWLEKYKVLQYNNIFDKKNRDEKMFPVVEPAI